ncbi:MAG: cyclic pyranopterin monophosphate synthase MoaC [Gammaproteobacteria bacterium]|nr:cyclic pyranopterin monophosphate synthase MoaC [Gammaproteobacteria bacterium]
MLSHIDDNNQPAMVDISGKAVTHRSAHARARVILPPVVRAAFIDGEIRTPKGPVFQTAIIAGTMAAKRTHELIPFCHPIGLDFCRIEIALDATGDVLIDCTTRVEHRTGVEMEALTGASVAALTIYDMCKALSHDIVIAEIRLITKTGGKTDIGANRSAP